MLLKISWRNIWRHKIRSLVIMLSVIIGVWAGTFLIAFYMGLTDDRITNAIETEISHIQIHHPEFKKEYDIKYDIPRGSEILQKISGNKNVKSAAGRIITCRASDRLICIEVRSCPRNGRPG